MIILKGLIYAFMLIYVILILMILLRHYKAVFFLRVERFLGEMIEIVFKNKL